MQIDAGAIPWQSAYKLLIGSIVPRPIGWISTLSTDGQPNLAPFSFFNAACANPPHVVFCPMVRSSDGGEKDTLVNLRATGEFVVNIATEALAAAVNLSATEFDPEVDEFQAAGVTPAPCRSVRPPRVAESPINLECRVAQIVDLGSQPGAGSVVIGRVLAFHIRDDLLIGADKIDLARLQPIARLAGSSYARVHDTFELERPPSQLSRVKKPAE
ncbi:MAG: flavin reductase family protein [Chloroflexota bacterium]